MLKQIENYLKTKFLQVPLKQFVITLIIIDMHCPCIITHDQGNKIKKKLHKGGRRKLTTKKKVLHHPNFDLFCSVTKTMFSC